MTTSRFTVIIGATFVATMLSACGGPTAVQPDASSAERLVRASMSLRGVRPSVDDLNTVTQDPSQLDTIVDGYLSTDEFGETIMDMHNEAWLARSEFRYINRGGPLAQYSDTYVNTSLSNEPLQLIRYIVMNNKPYTETVTAGYTVANEVVSDVHGTMPPHSGAPGVYDVAYWPDRPHAGVLSSSWIFTRHVSEGFNYNRARANAVTKGLLCYDFLATDIVIDSPIDLSDPAAVTNAVNTNPSCTGCHANLDPLASYFYGFEPYPFDDGGDGTFPVSLYSAANEPGWQSDTGKAPAYFGTPGTDLTDLGKSIAADPLFAKCAVQRFYGYFAQKNVVDLDSSLVTALQKEFVDNGYDAKRLAKSIVMSKEFDAIQTGTPVDYKKVRPEQMSRMIQDLTGYSWVVDFGTGYEGEEIGEVNLATNATLGYGVLAGGIDSRYVTAPSHRVNTTMNLYLARYAANAAEFVVDNDFGTTVDNRHLLKQVGGGETDEAAIRSQLVALHLRLYGETVKADSDSVSDAYLVFTDTLARTDDPARAWKITLTAMLQDLRIAHY